MAFSSKEDRISDLPDHILCHILSFLPTKHAVGTSVLSRRWIHLWESVPILDFDARLHRGFHSVINMNEYPEPEITFWNFVNRVMLLNVITRIQKFRLIYDCHYSVAPVFTWLNLAISSGVSELELNFFMFAHREAVLPRTLFMSRTLVVLKLSCMPLIVPSFVSFPKLKVLEIRRVVCLDEKCAQNLLSGCQVLEELLIEETTREKPRVIDISIPTLKRFYYSYRFAIDIAADCPYKFVINAPNLENFHIKGRISDDFVVKSLGTLINAHLDLRKTGVHSDNYSLCQERVFKLFKGIAKVKFLLLSNDIVQLLREAYDLKLPKFFNLSMVGLGFGVDICLKRLVIEFIKCSPNLEVLVLNNKQTLFGDIFEWSKSPPQPIPEHLSFRFKDILIQELYSTFLPEAAEYLVQDVNVLKRLNITCQCPFRLGSQIGDAF